MCGIVGTLRLRPDAEPVDGTLLAKMRDQMRHRGPDGKGLWVAGDGGIGLAHRRLAIIDLETRAAQPMHCPAGRFVMTFNGEIYNYRELRSELEELGVRDWRTRSDTEVLLYAFRQWGIAALERLRGMFAFAIWDELEETLWLVRDRLGIKPLYYAKQNDRLSFASEIKALLVDPSQPRRMDETGLFHYLSLMTTPAPMTMFAGISKLEAGTWLKVRRGATPVVQRWWDAWSDVQMLADRCADDLAETIRDELETAVRYRGVSDVPVGIFLSGGIDSSTNAALFAQSHQGRVKTFSIGYEGEHTSYRNELHYARRMADTIGADHHEVRLDIDQMIDFLPKLIHLQDEPIADPVCIPVYYLSKLARDNGVIVAQVGEGADELFAGYPGWHRLLKLATILDRSPGVGMALAGAGLAAIGRGDGALAEAVARRRRGEVTFWSGAETFTTQRKQRLMSRRLREAFDGRSSAEAVAGIRARFEAGAWEKSHLNWMTYVDLNLRLPELLLMRVDKMSMGVSLECRVPFLDHRLVTLALSIPTHLKLAGNTTKYMLKKAVRGLIPDELIDRRKQGFGVPVQEWFLDRLGPLLETEINAFLDASDVLDRTAVEAVFRRRDAMAVWWLYNLAAWHRHFIREWRPATGAAP